MGVVRGPQPGFEAGRRLRKARPYSWRQWLSLALVIAGGGLLGYVGGQYWIMFRTQQRLEAEWERETAVAGASDPARDAGAPGRATASGSLALTRMVIPKINLDAIVVEGTSRRQLIAGPGHIRETPLPGEAGNAVITGHRDTFFRHIFELDKGDEITLQRNGRIFRYQVTGKKIVEPTDVSVFRPTPDAQLTLITCYPTYYIGPAPERLVVFAKLAP